MPRIRSVKHDLFEDEALAGASRDARLLFIGLITWSDDHGNQRGNAALIRGHVFPYDEDIDPAAVEGLLRELHESGVVRLYKVDGEQFLHLRGWAKHQRIDNAGKPQVPRPEEADADASIEPIEATRGISPRFAAGGEGSGKDRKGVTTTSAKTPTRDDSPLSFLLADLIAGNDPDGKWTAPSKASCEAERLLKERDKRDEKQIRHVVEFVQEDDFERNVVHSMAKLRKRYGELLGKARDDWSRKRQGGVNQTRAGGRSARIEELLERGRQAAERATG